MCFRCAEKSLLFTLSDSLLFLTVGHMVFVIHCNVFFKGRHTFGLIIIRVSIGSFLFEIWPPFSFWPVSHLYQLKRCSSSSYNSRNEKRIKRWQITFPSFQHRLRRFLSKTVSPLSWKKGALSHKGKIHAEVMAKVPPVNFHHRVCMTFASLSKQH